MDSLNPPFDCWEFDCWRLRGAPGHRLSYIYGAVQPAGGGRLGVTAHAVCPAAPPRRRPPPRPGPAAVQPKCVHCISFHAALECGTSVQGRHSHGQRAGCRPPGLQSECSTAPALPACLARAVAQRGPASARGLVKHRLPFPIDWWDDVGQLTHPIKALTPMACRQPPTGDAQAL